MEERIVSRSLVITRKHQGDGRPLLNNIFRKECVHVPVLPHRGRRVEAPRNVINVNICNERKFHPEGNGYYTMKQREEDKKREFYQKKQREEDKKREFYQKKQRAEDAKRQYYEMQKRAEDAKCQYYDKQKRAEGAKHQYCEKKKREEDIKKRVLVIDAKKVVIPGNVNKVVVHRDARKHEDDAKKRATHGNAKRAGHGDVKHR